jgi:EAL domain-containing protein (putative c-di-GMP-specific phosphodiesterase class I)
MKSVLPSVLLKALEDGQFFLEYQPRVNPKTNQIMSAEALIRWNHPEWGIVPPNEFIPLAEETGIIDEIGEWVLHTVCKQIKTWKEKGSNYVRISINFSANHFLKANFGDRVIEITDYYDVHPQCIELEITECMLNSNEDGLRKMIKQLKEKGFMFAIDDFGTGYSSLSNFKKYKVDTLKIDRSLIKDISKDSVTKGIVSTIITLGKNLGMNVVAEGVEHLEELQSIMKMNCDEAQGYMFSQPIGIEKFNLLLHLGKCIPSKGGEDPKIQIENKRDFFRIDFQYPLESKITVLKIGGKPVHLGSTNVLVEDISAGGLCFLSNIKLPKRNGLLLGIDTEILGERVHLSGYIVWVKEVESGILQYGLELEIEEKNRENLTALLNKLQVKLRQKLLLKNCNFVTTDRKIYFNQR